MTTKPAVARFSLPNLHRIEAIPKSAIASTTPDTLDLSVEPKREACLPDRPSSIGYDFRDRSTIRTRDLDPAFHHFLLMFDDGLIQTLKGL